MQDKKEILPFFYEFHGSPFEVGRQLGSTLRQEIIDEYNRSLSLLCERRGMSESRFLAWHLDRHEDTFRSLVPRAVEEIEGMAAGAEISYPHAFFAATRDGAKILPPEDGCTSFYAGVGTTASGKPLLGQTKDTGAPLSRYRIVHCHYDDGLSTLNLNYPGWSANMGLSSHGLANTGNSLYGAAPEGETVPYVLLKRLAMEKQTVEEVQKAVAGLTFENGCFLVADKAGAALCHEWVGGNCAEIDISGRTFGHANRVLSPELQKLEEPFGGENVELNSSRQRQETVQRLLDEEAGSLDMAAFREIAADHSERPYSICRHAEDNKGKTTAAIIADLGAGRAQICVGNPCIAPWQEYTLS